MSGRLALLVKSWPHNCEAGVCSPSPVVPLRKELSTQLMGQCCCCLRWPKNCCAITCCITLLYHVRMSAPHYASSTVIHVSSLCAPFHNKQSMQTRRETSICKKKMLLCDIGDITMNEKLS